MQLNKNTPYYLTATALFIMLKFIFKKADNIDLVFLIKPTNKLLELLTSSHAVFIPENGYYHEQLRIVIDKSCSGFNFWLLCFALFTYLMVKYFDKTWLKMLAMPIAFIGGYVLTIFVNTSRIYASIIIQSKTKNIFLDHQHIVHEAIGIITNLTFLIVVYVLVEKLFKSKQHHAKPA